MAEPAVVYIIALHYTEVHAAADIMMPGIKPQNGRCMATATTLPAVQRRVSTSRLLRDVIQFPAVFITAGTAMAFLLLGYHPYAEDGGIYAAAVAARLNPALFPAEHAFAVAHTGRSLFVPLVAFLSRLLHVPLPSILLALYVCSLATTVAAARSLAKQLFAQETAQRWAVATLVVSIGLPVAGTSLYLGDPYLTARSLSTPLLLWAFALLLRRRMAAVAACLLIAFVLHPMMAATAAVLFAFTVAMRSARRALWLGLLVPCVLLAMALLRFVPAADGEAVRAASVSRSYWFPTEWAWYELVGLLAPLMLLPCIAYRRKLCVHITPGGRDLAMAAAASAAVVSAGMLLLVHPGDASMLLARLQPLRLLHTVYLVFVLLLGGIAGRVRLRDKLQLGWLVCAVAAISLFCMQHSLYADSAHAELPWRTTANSYEQAFAWAREHTPVGALFALDASYTTAPGENAQLFRAMALRSSLPDAAKDGGIASVMPQLAPAWQAAAHAQAGLASADDATRLARVRPLGATWMVLPAHAATQFVCPYNNSVAKVCRLP